MPYNGGPATKKLPFVLKISLVGEKLALTCSLRWLAVKLMEGDSEARALVRQRHPLAEVISIEVEQLRERFEKEEDETPEGFIALRRHL